MRSAIFFVKNHFLLSNNRKYKTPIIFKIYWKTGSVKCQLEKIRWIKWATMQKLEKVPIQNSFKIQSQKNTVNLEKQIFADHHNHN